MSERWQLSGTDDKRMIMDSESRYVCSVQVHQFPRHMGTYDENRRLSNVPLILAAPELLAVLKAMVADDAFAELCQGIAEEPQWLKDARVAVAKAEGKSPS